VSFINILAISNCDAVNCAGITAHGLKQPAHEIFSIKRTFLVLALTFCVQGGLRIGQQI